MLSILRETGDALTYKRPTFSVRCRFCVSVFSDYVGNLEKSNEKNNSTWQKKYLKCSKLQTYADRGTRVS